MSVTLYCSVLLFTAAAATAAGPREADIIAYGATPNDGTDDTAAIQAALNFVGDPTNFNPATGLPYGGIVRMPAGNFNINGRLTVTHNVDLRGAGMVITSLSCDTATAGVSFKVVNPTAQPRGGMSGHFQLKGNSISTNPLYIGWGAVRMFERIRVEGSADTGMLLEEVQNSFFVGVQVVQSGGANVILDVACRTVSFFECYFSQFGTDGVRIQHTRQGVQGSGSNGPRSSKIRFYGGLIEANAATGGACIAVVNGTDILIDATSFSGGPTPGVVCVRLDQTSFRPSGAGVPTVGNVIMRQADLQAGSGQAAIEVRNGSSSLPIEVFVETGSNFSGGTHAVKTDDNAIVHMNSYTKPATIPMWQSLGGFKLQNQIVRDLGGVQAALSLDSTKVVTGTYSATDEGDVLTKVRNRVNELENRLKAMGALPQ